jgi:hypothetical protein
VEITFTSEVIEWRGPAPFLFATIPAMYTAEIKVASKRASYGWGCIPCGITVGKTSTTTALFPKDGRYLLPIKVAIQRAEGVGLGDKVTATFSIDLPGKYR